MCTIASYRHVLDSAIDFTCSDGRIKTLSNYNMPITIIYLVLINSVICQQFAYVMVGMDSRLKSTVVLIKNIVVARRQYYVATLYNDPEIMAATNVLPPLAASRSLTASPQHQSRNGDATRRTPGGARRGPKRSESPFIQKGIFSFPTNVDPSR